MNERIKKYHYRGLHGMLSLWTVTSNESSINNYIKTKSERLKQKEFLQNK
jgi:hypothetical protein